MQIKLRKVLAILACLAMLCTVLPMGALMASAAETPVIDNNFNDGTNPFNKGSIVAEGPDGSNCLKWTASGGWSSTYQTINGVEKNADYVISFKAKASIAAMMGITIQNAGWGSYYSEYFTPGTEWEEYTIETNVGDHPTSSGGIMFKFQDQGAEMDLYIDDLVMVKKGASTPDTPVTPDEPADDKLLNADFEDGIDGWIINGEGGSGVYTEDAHTGKNSLIIKGTKAEDYSNIVKTPAVAVKAGRTYTLSYWAKNIQTEGNGASAIVSHNYSNADGTGKLETLVNTDWPTYTSEWKQYTRTLSPSKDGYVVVELYRINADTLYDDVQIYDNNPETPDEPAVENLVKNGDFETGDITDWTNSSDIVYEMVEGRNGGKAVKVNSGTRWHALVQYVTVEKNTDYVATFDAKDCSGITFLIKGADGNITELNPTGDWDSYTLSFNSGKLTEVRIMLMTNAADGSGTGIFDNIVLAKKAEQPEKPDDNNVVVNGDFELGSKSGWTTYSGTDVSTEAAKEGKYGMHLVGKGDWGTMVAQTVSVEPGREYLVSMWIKANSNGTNIQVKDGDNGGDKLAGTWYTDTQWTKLEYNVIPAEETIFLNFCGGGNNVETSLYLDSVAIVPVGGAAPEKPSELVVNGDFETGDASSWNTYQQTKVTADAKFEGSYGLSAKGDGGWGGLLNQTFALEKNTDYMLRYTVKAVYGGLNIQVRNAAGDGNLYYTYYDTSKGTEWTKIEAVFNSGENTSGKFNLVGSGTNGANGDELWFDNISVTKIVDDGEDIVVNNLFTGVKTSARDALFDSKGLAFRFDLKASGAEILANNQYVADSATIVPDTSGTEYKLLKAGAIVTNDAAVGAGEMTLDNVNGKKVINIVAKYLCDVSKKDLSFAVRIVDIPDSAVETNIYARPYYIYKDADGDTIVIYGNVESTNYNHVKTPKASIKILAIGNSFSQDAMNKHLYQVLESAGYQEIVLGNMYIGGCDLNTHWTNINNDRGNYTFYKTTDGSWKQTSSYKVSTAIKEEDWDYITIQQASPSSGQPATYSALNRILTYIEENKTNPNAKILWHMTWAYDEVNQNSGYSNYGNNQMKMYAAITDTVAEKVLPESLIDGVIPAGTAIQNMRTSKLKASLLCEGDGYHLSSNYGDYIAALTWYAYISGDDVSTLKYQPSVIADYRDEVNDAVMNAIDEPYKVTKVDTYDPSKSIKVLSIGHSFSIDVMGTYLYDMLESAGYEDITIGYLYYPGCSLSRHWEYISENKKGYERYGKNSEGKWVTKSSPYPMDVLRDEDWDFVTLQASPDYVGGENKEYSYIPGITDWIEENATNANVEIKWHQIWAYSTDCELWSNMYHKDPATGKYSQAVMYDNIIKATNKYIVTDSTFTGIIPSGTAVQNARTSFIGDNFNEPVVPGTQADGYHLNTKYGDFTGSLTWACYFSGKDANEITVRSEGMTEEEFKAIAEAVNNALAKPLELTESSYK